MNNFMYKTNVGYNDSGNIPIQSYFSDDTVTFIQQKINELLKTKYPQGVFVPFNSVINVMNGVFKHYKPSTGNIYSKYTIPGNYSSFNGVDAMINEVVAIIVNDIQTNLEIEANNSNLNIWNSTLTDGNSLGIRSYSTLRLNEKSRPFTFNMMY